MTTDTGEEADRVDLFNLSHEDALILWKFGGYGTEADFPGVRVATLLMLHGKDRGGRRHLARLFASLAPHAGVRVVLAVLRFLAARPAPIAVPAPAPRALSSQRRHHRIAPARAP
ncbi:hypothetical protein [Streptomyces sp. NPDC048659]|uniref:hypothetical protein n=1 Tax=Streptomyces sp. NPDC048659 TaxID=3155489 RepID=UPI00341C87D7